MKWQSWVPLVPGILLLFPGYFLFLWRHERPRRSRIIYLTLASLLFYGGIFATSFLRA